MSIFSQFSQWVITGAEASAGEAAAAVAVLIFAIAVIGVALGVIISQLRGGYHV